MTMLDGEFLEGEVKTSHKYMIWFNQNFKSYIFLYQQFADLWVHVQPPPTQQITVQPPPQQCACHMHTYNNCHLISI